MMWYQIVVLLLLVVDYFAEVEAKGKHWDNNWPTRKTKESRTLSLSYSFISQLLLLRFQVL